MACRMQRINPIELNFTFPENGCRSDLTIYHHPTVGQQRPIFGCDWDERGLTYDCNKLEPGVTWNSPDPKHAIIRLPENFEQSSGYFRYQISCYNFRQENSCSWDPVDEETADHIVQVAPVSSTTTMRTENTVQQDWNQNGNQAPIGLVAGVTVGFIVILALVLILIIAVIFLYKRNRVLKGMIRTTNNKLQQLTNTENQRRVESETEERRSAGKFWDMKRNTSFCSEIESFLSRKSPISFKIISADSDPPNLNSVRDFSSEICTPMLSRHNSRILTIVNKEDKGRMKSESGEEWLSPLSLVRVKEMTTEEENRFLDGPSPYVDKKH